MSTFPPTSIAVHTEDLVDNCEVAEMSPGSDPAVPVIELAALLYLGEYIHARHLWRRHKDAAPTAVKAALSDWWALGRALMESNTAEIWARLHHLQTSQPKPYCDYAQEVRDAVRRRMIPKLATLWSNTKKDVLLGLPRAEWAAFLEKHKQNLAAQAQQQQQQQQQANGGAGGGRDISDTIAYLETATLTV